MTRSLANALEDFRAPSAVIKLATPQTLVCTTAGTWYKIIGFTASVLNGFTFADNKVTFTGSDRKVLVNGETALRVDKACEIEYAFFLNGVQGAVTHHTFTASSKIESFGITGISDPLATSDYIEIWAKSTANTTTLVISELDVSFWGDII